MQNGTIQEKENPMGIKRYLREVLNSLVKRYDYEIIKSRLLYEWQQHPQTGPTYNDQSQLPKQATSYLQPNNPILKDLQARYSAFNNEVTAPLVWGDAHVRTDDVLYFRGDNAYVWQLRGPNMNEMGYALTAYYVESIDKLGLLETLNEDDLFGNFTFSIDNKLVSRDLLDSIIEIYFLERHLNLSSFQHPTVLDIGAGYGRLAHRMVCALPNIAEYLCTDAFPISTFISEYYIRFRNLEGRVKVIPLDKVEKIMQERTVNIAVNIHSFSECRISAIVWWLSVLTKYSVKYLMIVPNSGSHGGQLLQTNDGKDFGKVIEEHGYRLIAKEPKYRDSVVQKYAINPTYAYAPSS
jgi:putative sugar O-methyltransferase